MSESGSQSGGGFPARASDEDWEALSQTLSPGARVKGIVLSHHTFGFFVTIPSYRNIAGLVEITSYRPDGLIPRYDASGVLDPPFPGVGSTVEAEVLGVRDVDRRVQLRYLDLLAEP